MSNCRDDSNACSSKQLTEEVEGHGHKLSYLNIFSLHHLFDDMTQRKIGCSGTVSSNRKGVPQSSAYHLLHAGFLLGLLLESEDGGSIFLRMVVDICWST
jgi:hypothetical protein